ncbi:hypothetical protein B566_EDAN012348 [Ephemera danica]|nr:hypothetical protein B566_EDAN012348 [Ephemera danica]
MDKIMLYFTPPNSYVLKCPGNSTAPMVPGKCVNGTYIFPPIYHSCLDDRV